MKTIIDLLLIAIIIICVWTGYRKGLIMGIGGIIVIIISIFGANLLAGTFSYEVVPVLRPFAGGYLEGRLNKEADGDDEEKGVLEKLGLSDSELSIEDIIASNPSMELKIAQAAFVSLGITEDTASDMAREVAAYSVENDKGFMYSLTEVLCMRISFVACFALAFLILVIIFTVIGNITNLSFKIPNLDLVNDIAGAALGLVTGIMFCIILVWALKYAGIVIGEETIAETTVARWFMNADHLTKIIGY